MRNIGVNIYFFLFYLNKLFSNFFYSLIIRDNLLFCSIKPQYLSFFAIFLSKHTFCSFKQLLDIWGVDYIANKNRFEVNYLFISNLFNTRIILRTRLELGEGIESLTGLYHSAGWLEREVWDMFGVYFFNNMDLRRILTDYGFEGFPLRKDFPLSGYSEIRYDYEAKRVVFDSLELTQGFRSFSYNNNWVSK